MNNCSICHSKTLHKNITYTQWYKDGMVAVENVPADVCPICGEQYFSPEVVDRIQRAIEAQHLSRTLAVPVYELS